MAKTVGLVLLSLAVSSTAFLFPTSGGGCGCAPAPVPACGGGAAYPQQSYSAPGQFFPQPQKVGYVQQPQFQPQQQSQPQPQPQYQPQVPPPPPPPPPPPAQSYQETAPVQPQAPAGQSYQVHPAATQYEKGQGFSAAGDTLREVEEEDENVEAGAAASSTIPEVSDLIDIKQLKLTDDAECNSEDLRAIIVENIDEDLNSSKRLIQLAAEAKFGGRFDVVCSTNDFSYVTNTELFCQHTKETVSCYAYRQL